MSGFVRSTRGYVAAVSLLAASATVSMAAVASSAGAVASSITPVSGGNGVPVFLGTQFGLGEVGYAQSEFVMSGDATAYRPAPSTTLTADGKWTVQTDGTSPYTTRLVVHRPSNPAAFNGTVYVEWLNVSAGIDAAPDWGTAHNEIVRQGAVWVGVSAQKVGINGIKAADPVRYATLSHPGDSFSYDIFSQAGRAVRDQAATLLGGLTPQHVIADGESQSAFRMTTYIDAVHPLAGVYDGYMVHSNGASTPLSQPPERMLNQPPTGLRIRDDLDVPVFVFQTETDLVVFNSAAARQADSSSFRLWEAAGTAHADMYSLAVGPTDIGDGRAAPVLFDLMLHPTNVTPFATCNAPLNAGPQHWLFQAALHHLRSWVVEGTLPPTAPRLQLSSTTPPYALDGNGNVLGGVRSPHVDAPVAKLSGLGQSGNLFCGLFGTTTPFGPAKSLSLYRNHGRFVSAWTQATTAAVKAGYILKADADDVRSSAAASEVGR